MCLIVCWRQRSSSVKVKILVLDCVCVCVGAPVCVKVKLCALFVHTKEFLTVSFLSDCARRFCVC